MEHRAHWQFLRVCIHNEAPVKVPEALRARQFTHCIVDCENRSQLSSEQGARNVKMKNYGYRFQKADSLHADVRSMCEKLSNNINISIKCQEWCGHRDSTIVQGRRGRCWRGGHRASGGGGIRPALAGLGERWETTTGEACYSP